jgi:CBS domain-containing protein
MTPARDVMTSPPQWVGTSDSVGDAARMMTDEAFGMLPVCNEQGRLQGVVTDRDIIVKVVAEGLDPEATTVGDIADHSEVVTIGADDSVEAAIETMKRHGVRRLPVIDGTDLVGLVSQADIARALPDARIGDLVGAISSAPPNN